MSFIDTLYVKVRKVIHNLVFTNTDAIPFAARGKNVTIDKSFIYSGAENISFGDNTNVAPGCVMYATLAKIKIGSHVIFSPNNILVTGEHRTDINGENMKKVTNEMKLPQNDKDIVIEDDVWIGSNVTILKGVTIGRGSIIHAGVTVTKRVPPYTIYINDKLKVARFSPEEITEHERILHKKYGVTYPPYVPKKGSGMFSR